MVTTTAPNCSEPLRLEHSEAVCDSSDCSAPPKGGAVTVAGVETLRGRPTAPWTVPRLLFPRGRR